MKKVQCGGELPHIVGYQNLGKFGPSSWAFDLSRICGIRTL